MEKLLKRLRKRRWLGALRYIEHHKMHYHEVVRVVDQMSVCYPDDSARLCSAIIDGLTEIPTPDERTATIVRMARLLYDDIQPHIRLSAMKAVRPHLTSGSVKYKAIQRVACVAFCYFDNDDFRQRHRYSDTWWQV